MVSGSIGAMLISDVKHGPSETVIAELRDYPEWHRQRQRYGVWIVPVNDPLLLDYIEATRRRLADLLHSSEQRQPHLTLFVCGFEQRARIADDDFAPAQLHQQIESLQSLRSAECSLPLGAPDSFAGAAFIPVTDPLALRTGRGHERNSAVHLCASHHPGTVQAQSRRGGDSRATG